MENGRRKFLFQSGVITAGALTLNPLDSLASLFDNFLETGTRSLTILHSHGPDAEIRSLASRISYRVSNCLVLDTDKLNETAKPYYITQKGALTIGIIPEQESAHEHARLLKQKKCSLVVLVITGPHKDPVKRDLAIAAVSENIDIIVSTRDMKPESELRVALNKNQEEVLVHHVRPDFRGLGRLDIGFDEELNKNKIELLKPVV